MIQQHSEFRVSRSVIYKSSPHVMKAQIKQAADLNTIQMNMMNTIVKNTVLAIWGIFSSLIPETFAIIALCLEDSDTQNESFVGVDPILFCLLLAVDGTINCYCVFLSFIYAKSEYDAVCKCCDSCLANTFIKCAKRSIEKEIAHEIEEVQLGAQSTDVTPTPSP